MVLSAATATAAAAMTMRRGVGRVVTMRGAALVRTTGGGGGGAVFTSLVAARGSTAAATAAAAVGGSGNLLGLKAMHTSVRTLAPITPPPPPPSATSSSASSAAPPSPPSSSGPSSSASGEAREARSSNVASRPTLVRNKPLPAVPNTLPYLLAFVVAALASWGAFTIYATNKEKLSSSILKSVVSQVKASAEVSALLSSSSSAAAAAREGDSAVVVLKRELYLGGQPRVKGSVNMMQGRVDLAFRIHLAHDEHSTATVYFTSIRAHKHAPFEILRFVVVHDHSGESVSLLDKTGLKSIDVESGDIV